MSLQDHRRAVAAGEVAKSDEHAAGTLRDPVGCFYHSHGAGGIKGFAREVADVVNRDVRQAINGVRRAGMNDGAVDVGGDFPNQGLHGTVLQSTMYRFRDDGAVAGARESHEGGTLGEGRTDKFGKRGRDGRGAAGKQRVGTAP